MVPSPKNVSPSYLTKSLFQKACECPRKLKYALNRHRYPTT
eukprot:CAMPEP_0172467918 /NCGR_PEP_ID=MMETSP1065-20121228/60168_1 /TAXON_ID=265537 /ORGANISM="Amphiprora paludosa, Strain CCMP125" /LENGTH=40 /DNA_ID= /DNA_START= /DNA_END= /DNA_ORIENTATION=